MNLRIVLFCIGLLVTVAVKAQQTSDLALLKAHLASQVRAETQNPQTRGHAFSFPVRILFGFYRNVMSEQISADCAFDLSCSRFSAAAISKFGLFKGSLLTADRLTRCHYFVSQETVPLLFNNHTGKVIDEPSMY